VEPSGAKRWVLRTTINGRRRDFGLGSARDVSLRDAREQAAAWRRAARSGRDPTQERTAKRASLTFATAAEKVHGERAGLWRNTKHGAQWLTTLRTYAFPVIGKMLVGDVQPADVMKVLVPIWLTKPETARRVQQRIGVVLDWATTSVTDQAWQSTLPTQFVRDFQSNRGGPSTIQPSPGATYQLSQGRFAKHPAPRPFASHLSSPC